jgi:hypothetical protein
VTVLVPEGHYRQFSYDQRAKSLIPAVKQDSEVSRDALANVLMPAWLYRDQRYRLRK